jgi:uncharacterized protein (DUF58 family)
MVKEFEHQNDQDLAILLNLWMPRAKATPEQREAIESALRFAATACVEASRQSGRRILLGWTGPTPGVLQGISSTKLLHEQLSALAVMKPAMEGHVSGLLDSLPPACLRESLLVLISTQPVNLLEEVERSTRLSITSSRGLTSRVISLDVSRGDLDELIQFDNAPTSRPVAERR